MKGGAENRRKTVTLGILGAVALCLIIYNLVSFFGGSSTPPLAVAPVSSTPAPARVTTSSSAAVRNLGGGGAAPGVAPARLASTSSSLDPTLDQAAMLRTESLVYSGSGRNIFSAVYTAAASAFALPTHVPSARPNPRGTAALGPVGPPPPPPIPLKFFGTAQKARGVRQAFLLSGEDVYLAGVGDIVAKRYKINQILVNSVQVTDLVNNNTQTLPMQMQ